MTYCIEIWGSATQSHLNCLFLQQKKIIRIMNFSHYLAHTNSLFHSMEVLPFKKIYYHRIGLMQWCSGGGATGAIAPVPVFQGGAPLQFLFHSFLVNFAYNLQKLSFDLNYYW